VEWDLEHAVRIATSSCRKGASGTLETLDLARFLDVVTLFDVLEPSRSRFLSRLSCWLRPGGWIAVTLPTSTAFRPFDGRLLAALQGGAPVLPGCEAADALGRDRVRGRARGRAMKYLSVAFTAPLFTRYPVPW
jgi:hypothetical protein